MRLYNSKIYEDISVCIGRQSIIQKSANFYRKQIDYLDKFDYSTKNDTVFILEMYGLQGNVDVTIWNNNKTNSYTNDRNNFVFENSTLLYQVMLFMQLK